MTSAFNAKVHKSDLPITLFAAISLWVGSSCSYTWSSTWPSYIIENILFICFISVLIPSAVLLYVLIKKYTYKTFLLIFCVSVFLVLGVVLGYIGSANYSNIKNSLDYKEYDAELELISDLKTTEFGSSANALMSVSPSKKIRVKLLFDKTEEVLLTGARLNASVRLSLLSARSFEQSYFSGIVAQARVDKYELKRMDEPFNSLYNTRQRAITLIGQNSKDQAPILQALICGYRSPISELGEYENYKICGLAHVVAVSGAHLAIVVMAFGLLLRLFKCPKKITLILNITFVLAYLFFAGIPISAIRATIMVLLTLLSSFFGRRGASLNALAICIIAFIAVDITTCVSASFFLSAGSTLGIVLFSSLFASWMGKKQTKEKHEAIGKGIVEPLALTFSSNIVTLPFSVAMFSALPLISPISNIIATPLFTLGCVGGLVATVLACLFSPLAHVFLGFASYLVMPLQHSVNLMSKIPFANVSLQADIVTMIVSSLVICALLWVFWPKNIKPVLTCLAIAICIPILILIPKFFLPHGDELIMIDVGQGDAFLLRSEGASMLIDTGNNDEKLVGGLLQQGVSKLDSVLISHPDDDHCGSIDALSGKITVSSFLVANDVLNCACGKCAKLKTSINDNFGACIEGIGQGDTVKIGKFVCEILWPKSFNDEGGNSDSLCLNIEIDTDNDSKTNWKALFTGDAEKQILDTLSEMGKLSDVDIFKVGHHGSKISIDIQNVKILKPEIALISVGKNNKYGHPTQEAISVLNEAGSKIYRTDLNGSVKLLFQNNEIKVE